MTNNAGDIIDLDVISSDLPNGQEAFFESIAKSVEDGSYVCLKREDRHWMFVFEKGKFRTLDSEIAYYDKPISNKPNAETIAAMMEAERIATDTSVKGYTDMDKMFADLAR